MIELLIGFGSGIVGAVVGAVGSFFALRQRVVDMEHRVSRLENQSITRSECDKCQEKGEASISKFYDLAKKDADKVREVSSAELRVLQNKIDQIMEIVKGNNDAIGLLADRQTQVLIKLGLQTRK